MGWLADFLWNFYRNTDRDGSSPAALPSSGNRTVAPSPALQEALAVRSRSLKVAIGQRDGYRTLDPANAFVSSDWDAADKRTE